MTQQPEPKTELKMEPEHEGSLWKHPYMVYIWGTGLLFLFLLVMGYLAIANGWIPSRGVHS